VVAGVIGKKKFIYDMWGDTVNVAFRMSAECPAGGIQIDYTTYRRLQHRFEFGPAHEVDMKGKGRMQVYPLMSRRLASRPAAA
jgi:class 3 adenylate cyclase